MGFLRYEPVFFITVVMLKLPSPYQGSDYLSVSEVQGLRYEPVFFIPAVSWKFPSPYQVSDDLSLSKVQGGWPT